MRDLAVSILLVTLAGAARAQDPAVVGGILREIRVETADIFAAGEVEARPLKGLANAVHWRTRENVVRREIWLHPGDEVIPAQAAELERNLRALGIFAEVTCRLVAVGDGEHVDLEVRTRDRLSLNFGAGASLVGGITSVNTEIGEGNLFGLGDRVSATFRKNSVGEYDGSLGYTDLHVLDSWHTGRVTVSRSEEGDSFELDLRRPFKHLADPRAYGFAVNRTAYAADYYRGGVSVAEVPVTSSAFGSDITWASGPRNARWSRGWFLELEQRDYGTAVGPFAPQIRVPGDTATAFVGGRMRWNLYSGFRKVESLDTLDYVQDVPLGTFFGISAGARYRDERGAGGDLQPEVAGDLRWAGEPLTNVFVDLTTRGRLRWDGGRAVGWYGRTAGQVFTLLGGRYALGTNVVYDAVEELQDLPVELTLGEDNGLRGYPAREFAGSSRVRMNLENRFDTGIDVLTLRLGLVAFYDVGWIGTGSRLGRPFDSAGFGLRIGGKELLGSGV
ncbi:MAG: hypothetical protein KDE27_19135, partial [Planctomycetes bacterium]|nr:hypothetical protein [Planctomycetota bacterium]